MTTTHPSYATGPRDAEAYEAMRHDPLNPRVIASYRALTTAIVQQWNGLIGAGFEFIAQETDPYANSDQMFEEAGAGILHVYCDGGVTLPIDHPMRHDARSASRLHEEEGLFLVTGFDCLNDIFRAVHDVMGHVGAKRAGQIATFGPVGEFNAYWQHRITLPREAHMALWCETRGQNAWTNFYGDHQERACADRPYAEQKAGVVPSHLY